MSQDNSKQNNEKDNGRQGSNRSNIDDDDEQPMGEVIQNILATIISSMTESFTPTLISTPERPPSTLTPLSTLTSSNNNENLPFLELQSNDDNDDDMELENLIDLLRDSSKNQSKIPIPDSPLSSWTWKNNWKSPKKELQAKNLKIALFKNYSKLSTKLQQNDIDREDSNSFNFNEDEWQFQPMRHVRGRMINDRRIQKQVKALANDDTELVQELCEASCRKLLDLLPDLENRIKRAFDDAFMNIANHQVEFLSHLTELEKIFTIVENAFRDRIDQLRNETIFENAKNQ